MMALKEEEEKERKTGASMAGGWGWEMASKAPGLISVSGAAWWDASWTLLFFSFLSFFLPFCFVCLFVFRTGGFFFFCASRHKQRYSSRKDAKTGLSDVLVVVVGRWIYKKNKKRKNIVTHTLPRAMHDMMGSRMKRNKKPVYE